MGSLGQRMGKHAQQETAASTLSYDSRSWLTTFKLLDPRHESLFVIVPWLLFTGLYVALAVVQQHHPEMAAEINTIPSVGTLGLGSVMSMLLAFRLNASYTRWWMARQFWGDVINGTRCLLSQLIASSAAQQTQMEMPSSARSKCHEQQKQVGGWCIAFAVAMGSHLRGQRLGFADETRSYLKRRRGASMFRRDLEHGKFDGLLTLLGKPSLVNLAQSTHPPMYALLQLRHAIEAALITPAIERTSQHGDDDAMRRQHKFTGGGGRGIYNYAHVAVLADKLFDVTASMLGALTGCERILRTPLPPGYVGVLRFLVVAFLAILPFALMEGLGWGLIPCCSVFAYLVLEVEETAVQIEQPFGFEYNDLPLDSYCLTVQADVLRLLDESWTMGEESSRGVAKPQQSASSGLIATPSVHVHFAEAGGPTLVREESTTRATDGDAPSDAPLPQSYTPAPRIRVGSPHDSPELIGQEFKRQ